MREYDEAASIAPEPVTDPRIAAVQRVVHLERKRETAQGEVARAAKARAILDEQLEEARTQLFDALGLSTNKSALVGEGRW